MKPSPQKIQVLRKMQKITNELNTLNHIVRNWRDADANGLMGFLLVNEAEELILMTEKIESTLNNQ